MKDKDLLDNYSINFNGNLLNLDTPIVMSILNTTPDSFYDGGNYNSIDKALIKVESDLENGATIIDIGGYSTRPNGMEISQDEEIKRTIPYIESILRRFPKCNISIDTFRGKVAAFAIDVGAGMINDVSGWNMDSLMLDTIKKYKVPYILMHMKGQPINMQNKPTYNQLIKEILDFFIEKIQILKDSNINDIVVDPGFGFGKTVNHNYKILGNLEIFKLLNVPIMVGLSRKSMITKYLKINKKNSLNSTTALNMYALSKGAKILRVHDVKEAIECIQLNEKIKNTI